MLSKSSLQKPSAVPICVYGTLTSLISAAPRKHPAFLRIDKSAGPACVICIQRSDHRVSSAEITGTIVPPGVKIQRPVIQMFSPR